MYVFKYPCFDLVSEVSVCLEKEWALGEQPCKFPASKMTETGHFNNANKHLAMNKFPSWDKSMKLLMTSPRYFHA